MASHEKINLPQGGLKFSCPCAISICGGSMSGKTSLAIKLVQYREQMFSDKFDRIIYCQSEEMRHQSSQPYEELKRIAPGLVELHEGLPDVRKLNLDLDQTKKLVIIDDQMQKMMNDSSMLSLVTIHIHHSQISLIYCTHNGFPPSKFGKTIARNTQVKFIFYNRLELTELRILSCQMGKKSTFLLNCFKLLFEKFPNESYHYIMIDGLTRDQRLQHLYVRTNVFPVNGKIQPIIFFEK